MVKRNITAVCGLAAIEIATIEVKDGLGGTVILVVLVHIAVTVHITALVAGDDKQTATVAGILGGKVTAVDV